MPSNALGCLSSPRNEEYLDILLSFNGQSRDNRTCCLSRFNDRGTGNTKPDQVMAAHIIPHAFPDAMREINRTENRKKLSHSDPKDGILLQRKWEILFDRHCWCLRPANLLSSSPPKFLVHVLVPRTVDDVDLSLMAESNDKGITVASLRSWVEEIQQFDGSTVEFAPDAAPSYRALAWHAQRTYDNATKFMWIEQDNNFADFSALSPMLSPRVAAAGDASGAGSVSRASIFSSAEASSSESGGRIVSLKKRPPSGGSQDLPPAKRRDEG
jgi:hypothetical protein